MLAGLVSRSFPSMKNLPCTCFTINRSANKKFPLTYFHHTVFFFFKAGFTVRSFDFKWDNFEWDQDDHMEELWSKGEAGLDLDSFREGSFCSPLQSLDSVHKSDIPFGAFFIPSQALEGLLMT